MAASPVASEVRIYGGAVRGELNVDLTHSGGGSFPYFQAIRRCYHDFYIADTGRPVELRTIRVDKPKILKRYVEDGLR